MFHVSIESIHEWVEEYRVPFFIGIVDGQKTRFFLLNDIPLEEWSEKSKEPRQQKEKEQKRVKGLKSKLAEDFNVSKRTIYYWFKRLSLESPENISSEQYSILKEEIRKHLIKKWQCEQSRKHKEELLSVKEASSFLKVSQPSVRLWVTQGKIQVIRNCYGPGTLLFRSEIEEFVNRRNKEKINRSLKLLDRVIFKKQKIKQATFEEEWMSLDKLKRIMSTSQQEALQWVKLNNIRSVYAFKRKYFNIEDISNVITKEKSE